MVPYRPRHPSPLRRDRRGRGLKPRVLVLSPEPPYPLHGGGAYRTASLLHHFSRIADVDLILISESGQPALLPEGLVRSQKVIPLPVHGKGLLARYRRNAGRALRGVPPLIDRLSGLGPAITDAIGSARYDLGIVEHFWCAPYLDRLQSVCDQTVLDLHNLESVLHERCGAVGRGLVSLGHKRFAAVTGKLERKLFPQYSLVLAASQADADLVHKIAPSARTAVYPNALPWVAIPPTAPERVVVFSGNFEYHPNIDAVYFLLSEIWPEVRKNEPNLHLRLVGRGDISIRHLIPQGSGVEVTGPVPDAFAEIARAAVVIAPLRAGSGTRIKILEAWAAARPVVATPLAAEGLTIREGENIVLAQDPAAFARAVLRLLSDPAEATRIGAAGRAAFEQNYTWEAASRVLGLNLQLTRTVELSRYTG